MKRVTALVGVAFLEVLSLFLWSSPLLAPELGTMIHAGGLIRLQDIEEESVSHVGNIKKKVLVRNGQIPHIMQVN
jgi:hypothetical protein